MECATSTTDRAWKASRVHQSPGRPDGKVRKEIIVRPKDLQEWIDLGLESRDTIPVDIQTDLKQAVLEFLREHHPVAIDGKAVEPDYQRIDFLERTLKSSRVIDPPEELDLDSAMLGVIFVYLTEGLPESVTMDWDLFNDRIQLVPAAAVDQAGPLPTYLEPDFAVLEWQNFLKNPKLPTLTALAAPPGRLLRWATVLRWPTLLAAGEGGIAATASWIVSGSIGHWGHLHQRRNRYRASLDIRPQEGVWKLAGLEILEEERM